jgi:hypothetical protein
MANIAFKKKKKTILKSLPLVLKSNCNLLKAGAQILLLLRRISDFGLTRVR